MITHLIKFRRKDLGMTQIDLSDLTGITQGNISKIERGIVPRFDDAMVLLKALKIKVEFKEELNTKEQ